MDIKEFLSSKLKTLAYEKALEYFLSKASFLSLPVINPLFAFFLRHVIDYLYDQGAFAVNWLWISVEKDQELKAAVESREKLQKILDAGENYEQAQEEFNEAALSLIRHRFDRLPR